MSSTFSFFLCRMAWLALLLVSFTLGWPQAVDARPPQLTMPPAKKLPGPLAPTKPAFRRAHAMPAVPARATTPTLSPTTTASAPVQVASSTTSRWPLIFPLTTDRVQPVLLVHGKTGEHYRMMLVSPQGRLREQTLTEMRDFLACSKTSQDHPIHPRLLSLLHAVAAAYPGKSLIVHSGYRHPQVSHHAKRSNHTRGRAIDFRVQGIDNRELFERVRHSFTGVGVGYYPNSAFVHLDVRDDEALWVDYAAPGDNACYSRTPTQDLANGIAEQLSAEQARIRGCDGPGKPDKSAPPPVQKASSERQAQAAVAHDKSAR